MLYKETATEDVPVDMDHFIVSPRMKLTLQGAVPSDSGIYICQNYFTIHAVYNIDVVGYLNSKTVGKRWWHPALLPLLYREA